MQLFWKNKMTSRIYRLRLCVPVRVSDFGIISGNYTAFCKKKVWKFRYIFGIGFGSKNHVDSQKVRNFWYNFQNFWPFFRLIFERNRQCWRCFRIIFDIFKNFGQKYTRIFVNMSKMTKILVGFDFHKIFGKILFQIFDCQNTGKVKRPKICLYIDYSACRLSGGPRSW